MDGSVAVIYHTSMVRLAAWVILNYLHFLLTPCAGYALSRILHSLKSFTSQEANKQMVRKGRFWQADYFDRYVRDARHFSNAATY
ncbi:MAG TPA: transposase [Blastocatellia bacterium]|nr:transposase [Blastocatellia bacterium]